MNSPMAQTPRTGLEFQSQTKEFIMKKQNAKSSNPKTTTHPGSSTQDAQAIGGPSDFGVPESDVIERTYTSQNTKRSDPGNAVPRSGSDGARTAGVGGNDSGPGSSSGGDIDTDIVGIKGPDKKKQ
jgi:hypothetical protein